MKHLTLTDFDNLPRRTYQKENPHKCVFCNETANNGGFNMCNSHTDTYRKLKRAASEAHYQKRLKEVQIDFDQLEDLEVDGINHADCPDYCDAFIASGSQNGTPLTDAQLDFLNDDSDFVYQLVQDQLY